MLKKIFSTVKVLFLIYVTRIFSSRDKQKRKGKGSDICLAMIKHEILVLELSDTSIELQLSTRNLDKICRNMVGQIVFTRHGFPKIDRWTGKPLIPDMKLVLYPTVLKMGMSKLIQFVEDWPGTSTISTGTGNEQEDITVVTYSI